MLKGKLVVITGGAGKLGQAFVRNIKKNGGVPVIADVKTPEVLNVVEMLDVEFIPLDITKPEIVEKMFLEFSLKKRKIDTIVNNAYPRNKNYGRKFEDVKYEDFCENVSMHLGGYFLVTQKAVDYFKKQKYGNIVNISSIYGIVAPRFGIYESTTMTMPVEYAAIKAAIIHLTKYVAKYCKGFNIRCNAISLGGIKDAQPKSFIDMYNSFSLNKGMLDSNDVAGTLTFLISDISKYINGQNIVVDDGWTL